jgi:hypothetical protein
MGTVFPRISAFSAVIKSGLLISVPWLKFKMNLNRGKL